MKRAYFLSAILTVLLAGCFNSAPTQGEIRVELIDGNVKYTYVYSEAISVDEFLTRINADTSDLDRIDPPRYTQIYDGIAITIVRVTEENNCFEEELPFETRRIPHDSLPPGVEEILQAGENGVLRVCERCVIENGVQTSCTVTSETPVQEAREEIIYYGSTDTTVPIVIDGRLAYISSNQGWIIEGNTSNRRVLTVQGQLDGLVFDLSPNGRQLLYTALTENPNDLKFSNELHAIPDTGNPEAVNLGIENVLSGQWLPGQNFTISYSTAEPSTNLNGWEAYNDLWLLRIDSRNGQTLDVRGIVEQNAIGIYSYWGTKYLWSPDGEKLAWSRADGAGIVDLATGEFSTLVSFPHFEPAIISGWVWQPDIAWSQDGDTLITTVHGAPYGSESEINSIIFNVAALVPERDLVVDSLIARAGIWAHPVYSPIRQDSAGFPDYQIAYLQARDPLNSLGGEYDLVIADRDGSNPRVLFPTDQRDGIRPFNEAQGPEFVWSPTGEHIAIIYQSNLWVIEVSTGLAQQITTDRRTSRPRWSN